MSIFSRLSDIINSNLTSLLDRAENPQKMVRMIIQEMEETLVEVRSGTAKVIADKKTIGRRISQLRRQAEDWQRKAELAMSKEREDLAKAALVEKAAINKTIALQEEEMEKLDATLEKLGNEIEQLQDKLDDARARQKALSMRGAATESRVQVNRRLHNVDVDRALNRFDYYEKKIDMMEGEVESLNLRQRSLHDEFEELAQQEQIDRELDALKNKVNKQSD